MSFSIMLDLETLSTRPEATILTFGAIKFSPYNQEPMTDGIYYRINVDEVVIYQTEQDLIDLLLILPLDVRVLGIEYEHSEFTGKQECMIRDIELVYNGRDHSFSSSSLRKRVAHAETIKLLKDTP